mmetsp:Transcript_26000/g.62628  ORF Transcript_26000/g.62628 Transcript_26000/m.62628 type:complete len:249 (+) Transcript_26000:25-771(+)
MLDKAPRFEDVADNIYRILHDRIWAGHNIVRFDNRRIEEEFKRIGKAPPVPKGVIDTYPLLRASFGAKRAGNLKMATLGHYFGLGAERHRALEDSRMNIEVLKNCATVLFLEQYAEQAMKESVEDSATLQPDEELDAKLLGLDFEDDAVEVGEKMKALKIGESTEQKKLNAAQIQLKDRLQKMMDSRTKVLLDYSGGKPGVRPIIPISWDRSNKFKALCVRSGIEKFYLLERVVGIHQETEEADRKSV